MPTLHVVDRYADLRDRRLAARLAAEDAAEERGLDPFERITCRTHRNWLHHCVGADAHVILVTGHRWCRACERPVPVVVDELAGQVLLRCPGCGRFPDSPANRLLVQVCARALAVAQGRPDGLRRRRPRPAAPAPAGSRRAGPRDRRGCS
ncbi:hypothetical protein LWP59_15535 [Amycolatopsis acidiphila]|uniref:hypothetical protein n=1 Tax=Amycolatopsis acidiphila TaxID=715473 RepID=UPI001643D0C8|nr:hypothetical protein [Amycolatopsis acidiphila]UIJ62929.1 hypothetical protein LWP59_15535 [Amycolatopsis acidiphila]GHG65118.1 hypothetical protein GCM10017788_22380 [Amycolatopsis acidiphila]